mgnify:CR=1 FL=1
MCIRDRLLLRVVLRTIVCGMESVRCELRLRTPRPGSASYVRLQSRPEKRSERRRDAGGELRPRAGTVVALPRSGERARGHARREPFVVRRARGFDPSRARSREEKTLRTALRPARRALLALGGTAESEKSAPRGAKGGSKGFFFAGPGARGIEPARAPNDERLAPRVPSGALAAARKGDDGSGARPELSAGVAAAFRAFFGA